MDQPPRSDDTALRAALARAAAQRPRLDLAPLPSPSHVRKSPPLVTGEAGGDVMLCRGPTAGGAESRAAPRCEPGRRRLVPSPRRQSAAPRPRCRGAGRLARRGVRPRARYAEARGVDIATAWGDGSA